MKKTSNQLSAESDRKESFFSALFWLGLEIKVKTCLAHRSHMTEDLKRPQTAFTVFEAVNSSRCHCVP